MSAVSLNLHEVMSSCVQAAHRIIASNAQNLNHASTYKRPILERFRQELDGCIGERAFCKWLGVYSAEHVNTFHDVPDCGEKFEVRSTSNQHGKLIVRDNDAEDRIYVLVCVEQDGSASMRGWMRGKDAKIAQYAWNPNGVRMSFFVPQDKLNPMHTLPTNTRRGE